MSEIFTNLAKVLPQLAIIAAVAAFIGWWLRGPKATPAPAKTTAPDKAPQDRSKNLESQLEKSKAAHKALKSEFDSLKAASVSKEVHDQQLAELAAAQTSLATESKRTAVLDVELKKVQETLKGLNARSNEASKAQKDRSFALENELSKARQELAVLHNRPDDSSTLQAEIERLRESVATSTRFAGELRKREAAAIEALERAQAQLAAAGDSVRPAAARKIGPVAVESDRVTAAKAEVLRLIELNRQKQIEPVAAVLETIPAATPAIPVELPAAVAEEPVDQSEEPIATQEQSVVAAEEPVAVVETPVVTVEEPVVAVEKSVAVAEEPVVAVKEPAAAPANVEADESAESLAESDAPSEDAPPTVKKAPVSGELFALD